MESFIQENYLKNLYLLGDAGTRPVRTNRLSAYINTSAASVSDMLQKLRDRAYVHYEKYRGARLSDKGRSMALSIIRRHRLWEVFLHKKLRMDSDKVHELAEQLEHIRDAQLIQRLDTYLGCPQHDPHGASIPTARGTIAADNRVLLSGLPLGATGQVVAVRHRTPTFLRYMKRTGLRFGDHLQVQAKEPYDGSLELLLRKKDTCFISEKAAHNLYIQKT